MIINFLSHVCDNFASIGKDLSLASIAEKRIGVDYEKFPNAS